MLIDTHAHLFWDSFKEDLSEVIQRAVDSGVGTVINVGVNVEKSQIAAELESDNPQMEFYSTIGIHPHEAIKYSGQSQESRVEIENDTKQLEKIYLKNPQKVIAVGECGLDYFFDPKFPPNNSTIEQCKQLQIKLFQAQIDLAKKLDLPLLIHVRDDRTKNPENVECWETALAMLQDWRGILHCYSGTLKIIQKIPPNFLVSFAGNLTYPKNDYLKEAVKIFPLERIVLETDCPFLAPQSNRGKRNEPASVLEIAQTIAEIKSSSLEKVAQVTSENFNKLFRIKL